MIREGSALVERLTGIRVPEYRHPLLHAEFERIGGRWGVKGGMRRVAAGDQEACSQLISSITIPETYLFRHFGHFELLRELAAKRSENGRATRVLSAGCSTGEEAWSAAAILASVACPPGENHVVVGWELCGERLRTARAGRFTKWSCRSGLKGLDEFFEKAGDEVIAGPRLREFTVFQQINLVDDELPLTGAFDVVLFRNVAIYWGDETTENFFAKLASLIDEGGVLLVGPSDPVSLPGGEWKHRINHAVRSYRRFSKEEIASAAPTVPSIRECAREVAGLVPPVTPRVPEPHTKSEVQVFKFSTTDRADSAGDDHPSPSIEGKTGPELIDDPIQSCLARARVLADAGEYSEAVAMLESHDAGKSVEGKLWRGILSLSLEHDAEAVRLFRQCVFLRSEVAEYHRWLAVALEATGWSTEAARAQKNAAELGEQ